MCVRETGGLHGWLRNQVKKIQRQQKMEDGLGENMSFVLNYVNS